ncbi:MAG TPA: class I SAM-dependent methyltransferase [Dehalococcoidia bacterium]|nr:class I SAM-dependent methyltransferase [Dehalococcoidia bacterium]
MNNADAEAKLRNVEISFGESAPIYDKSPYFAGPGRRIVELAGISAGDRVLDIATGRGASLFPACERVGLQGQVLGIDLAEPMIAATGAEILRRGIRQASVQKMNAERLDLADSSYDAVLCGFSLNFIPNLMGALLEVRRVLKPGGVFAASSWGDMGDLNRAYRQVLRTYGAGVENLVSHSLGTPEALAAALQEAGFAAVEAHDEAVTASFASPEDWWERTGQRPQGTHMLTPEQRRKLQQEGMALAETFRSDGFIRDTRTAVLTTGRNP